MHKMVKPNRIVQLEEQASMEIHVTEDFEMTCD